MEPCRLTKGFKVPGNPMDRSHIPRVHQPAPHPRSPPVTSFETSIPASTRHHCEVHVRREFEAPFLGDLPTLQVYTRDTSRQHDPFPLPDVGLVQKYRSANHPSPLVIHVCRLHPSPRFTSIYILTSFKNLALNASNACNSRQT